jgi:hypothetical protein
MPQTVRKIKKHLVSKGLPHKQLKAAQIAKGKTLSFVDVLIARRNIAVRLKFLNQAKAQGVITHRQEQELKKMTS